MSDDIRTDHHGRCSSDLEQHCATVLSLITAREEIAIAEAAQSNGIPAEIITTILAIYCAVADEMLKRRSLH